MPRTVDHPLATFKNCLEIANAVDELGGSCSIDSCAHKLGKQPTSGAYKMLVSSSNKYGLVNNNRGTLTTSSEYRLLKHAYTEEEKLNIQRKCFLRPEVFTNLYQRFLGKALPINMLDKLMIREMGVDENTAGRVAGYFVKGLRELNLIDGGGVVQVAHETTSEEENKNDDFVAETAVVNVSSNSMGKPTSQQSFVINPDIFTVSISGPGVNNTFQITEEEDLEWVEVAIRKIKRALRTSVIKDDNENAV